MKFGVFTINLLSKLYFWGTMLSELQTQETFWFLQNFKSLTNQTSGGWDEKLFLLVLTQC